MSLKDKNQLKQPILSDTHWSYFAISEGLTKTVQLWIFKIIGSTLSLFPIVFVTSFVVGCVQIIGGIIINRRSRYVFFPGFKYVIGSLLLGVVAVYTTIIPIYIFSSSKADLALLAFVVSLAIIPKFLIDKLLFSDSVELKHLLSIPVFLFALYAFLGFPSITEISSYSLWFWLALTLPVASLVNEYIAKPFKVSVISVWVRNFWAGIATVILSTIALIFIKPTPSIFGFVGNISSEIWFLFLVLGFSVLVAAFVRQRTYMHGGSIVSKKMTMIGTYLLASIIVGLLFLTDTLSLGKVIGVISLIFSYFLVESSAFKQLVDEVRLPTSGIEETEDSQKFDFNGLIIFEMSKNHGGDLKYALRIVREFSEVANDAKIKGAIKLQFRNLESYIHPDYRKGGDERMQRYFTSHLSDEDFGKVVDEIKAQGLISISTPFDEDSVDTIDKLGVEIIKIASSAAKDWSLLERVVKSNKPIVCSTGGAGT